MTDTFDPAAHRIAESRYFDDFQVGERFNIPSRTITHAHFAAFQTLTTDDHPIHYDVEYCRRHGHRDLLAHGFQTLVLTAPGAGMLPHYLDESLVAFLEQSSRFLGPVYAGDTLYPALVVTALTPQRSTGVIELASTVHNQDGTLVLEGAQKLLVRKRPA